MKPRPLVKASSIILTKQTNNQLTYLLLKRKGNISFPGMCVFPGGVCEKSDKLIEGFENYGIITGIRQSFQQCGLMLIPQSAETQVRSKLTLSQQDILDYIYALWSQTANRKLAQPILRLLTVQIMKGKRFDCIFYVLLEGVKFLNYKLFKKTNKIQDLQNLQNLILDQESVSFSWQTCRKYIDQHTNQKIQLAFPQLLILSCLNNFQNKILLTSQLKLISHVEPIMFQFKPKGVIFPRDDNYDIQQMIENQPQSQSKVEYIQALKQIKSQQYSPCQFRINLNHNGLHATIINVPNVTLIHFLTVKPQL